MRRQFKLEGEIFLSQSHLQLNNPPISFWKRKDIYFFNKYGNRNDL